jgi:hypothetical protein
MVTKGAFGYLIGKKKRLMPVNDDADLLWQILVREIYVLMKHFKTKEELQKAFEKIVVAKNKPKVEHCKCFADFENDVTCDLSWASILRHCQSSFINVLEAGYILNDKIDTQYGHIFLLDFNKGSVVYSFTDYTGKNNEIDSAKVEEIMLFDEMPSKSYTEIVSEMRYSFAVFYENITRVRDEIDKLNNLLVKAKQQGAANIEEKLDKLLYEMKMEERKLNVGRRVFYNRLKALDLIADEK